MMPTPVTTETCEQHRTACVKGRTPLWAFLTALGFLIVLPCGAYAFTWAVSSQVSARLTVAEHKAVAAEVIATVVHESLKEIKDAIKSQTKEIESLRLLIATQMRSGPPN